MIEKKSPPPVWTVVVIRGFFSWQSSLQLYMAGRPQEFSLASRPSLKLEFFVSFPQF
jgi:hypothetical protein